MGCKTVDGDLDIVGLKQRLGLIFIGKHEVERAIAHQPEKILAVTVDAEHVGQCHGDRAASTMRHGNRLLQRADRGRRVPQIAFQIGDLGGGDPRFIDIGRVQLLAAAQEGAHGALGIGRNHDQALCRRHGTLHGLGSIVDTNGADIVLEHAAQLVVGHPPDKAGFSTERGNSRRGVGRRPAGHFAPGPHFRVKRRCILGRNQPHRALGDAIGFEKAVILRGNHIDNGIAHRQHVELVSQINPHSLWRTARCRWAQLASEGGGR